MKIKFDVIKKSHSQFDRIWMEITVYDKAGAEAYFCLVNQHGDDLNYCVELDTEALFAADGKTPRFSDVPELAGFLMDAIEDKHKLAKTEEEKKRFLKDISEKITSIEDVAKIVVEKRCETAYEDVDLDQFLPAHDEKLRELAQKVTEAPEDDREAAVEALQGYINAPHGDGERDVRYHLEVGTTSFLRLAKMICTEEYPECTWRERWEIDTRQGGCRAYTEYDLTVQG